MSLSRIPLVLIPIALLTTSVLSRSSGTIPGVNSIALDSTRAAPSCTACHSGSLGQSGVRTSLSAVARSLDLSESVQVTVQVTGGPSGTSGGFAAENTAGTFATASNVQVSTTGRAGQFATHTSSRGRSWTFPFAAPAAPGLLRIFAVGMAADGTGGRSNDGTALAGSDPTSATGTPVYVGVNAAGNRRYGQGCVGSYGNWAVLYSDQVPTIGNAGYAVQLAGAAPNAMTVFLFGIALGAPIDLSVLGATGCGLWVNSLADLTTVTGTGNARLGEGVATGGLPIPNTAALRGVSLGAQAVIVDAANGRSLPLTVTEGLRITIR